jgi:hypothetical protein
MLKNFLIPASINFAWKCKKVAPEDVGYVSGIFLRTRGQEAVPKVLEKLKKLIKCIAVNEHFKT